MKIRKTNIQYIKGEEERYIIYIILLKKINFVLYFISLYISILLVY